MPVDQSLIDRFNEKWVADEETGCWLWTGATVKGGYGQIKIPLQRHQHRAHRLSFMIHKGAVPKGKHVCHSCDTPACVNPEHLFLGSSSDNHQDMKAKGRHLFGERNAQAKLTEQDVEKIRAMSRDGQTQRSIAQAVGISLMQVNRIVRGLRWAHSATKRPAMARLSERDVAEIRAIAAAGALSQARLAQLYGVSQMQISRIVRGHQWAAKPDT